MNPSRLSSSDPLWLSALARLPLWVFRFAGLLMAGVLYLGARRRRRVVERNLHLCFPEASPALRAQWTWQTFLSFSQAFLDRVWLWHAPPEVLRRRVRLLGDLGLLAGSQPVVLFAPHFVGLDAAWSILTATFDRPWMTMYSPQISMKLDRWVSRGRSRYRQPVLVPRRQGARTLAKGLREGAAVYLLPDMDLGPNHAVFAPFFGTPAATVTSLSRLSALGQAAVVPVRTRMVGGGYEVELLAPWQGFPSGDDMADATRMNAELESYIRATPGQYHWLHRRFKTRPPGEPSLYTD